MIQAKNGACLVTGASSGIGRATALALAREGWTVAVAGRDEARVAAVAAECSAMGPAALSVVLDLRDVAAIRTTVDCIEADAGPIELLVLSAGQNLHADALDVTEDDWDSVFDLNVKGAFFCAQAVACHMASRARGHIVTLSSIEGMSVSTIPYGLSKWAVEGMTRNLARQLGRHGIRVNGVAPGPTTTAMNAMEGAEPPALPWIPGGRFAKPEEVAGVVAFLAGDAGAYLSGTTIVVDGGFLMNLAPPAGAFDAVNAYSAERSGSGL